MTAAQMLERTSKHFLEIVRTKKLTPAQSRMYRQMYHELQMLLCAVEEKNFRSDSHEEFAIQLR